MRPFLRHFLPGLLLIIAAAAGLLLSDLRSRKGLSTTAVQRAAFTPAKPARVAIFQINSSPVMEQLHAGVVDALASRGYKDGGRLAEKTFNPEGDLPTANIMARQIVSDGYDLGISISTLALQSLANADREGKIPIVLCGVSNPVIANIGIQSLGTLDKPTHITGIGTAQPVEAIFREAVASNPSLKTVGVVWNPSEANSLYCTERARKISKELGITLIEAPIEGTKDAKEAAASLVSRGAQAFWTGGDATMLNALDVLQQTAETAKIPVLSNIFGHAKKGALLDLGANYYQVGYQAGLIAADVLDGQSPATIPINDFDPKGIGLNEKTRATLADTWTFTPSQLERANYIVDTKGDAHDKTPSNVPPTAVAQPANASDTRPLATPPNGHLPWSIKTLLYVESAPAEECFGGVMEGLHNSGLVEGRDYTITHRSAQSDMSSLNTLFDAASAEGADLYLTLSTPTLQAAVRKVTNRTVIFTFVADAVAAGAGKSATDHLPNFTGISTLAPANEMAALIKTYFPTLKRLGTIYCPNEINSQVNLKAWSEAAAKIGLTVVPVPANASSDLPDASLALAQKDIDAIVQIADNLSAAGFPNIARAAKSRHIPLLTFQSPMVQQGAGLALSIDYHDAGVATADFLVRIMRGDNPATIPFSLPTKQTISINLSNARESGLIVPQELVNKAGKVVP